MNTDDPVPEPESPSRIFEKSGHEVEDIDTSLFKDRWVDPNKHPKDLDNWGKATSQEYRPDVRFLQVKKGGDSTLNSKINDKYSILLLS